MTRLVLWHVFLGITLLILAIAHATQDALLEAAIYFILSIGNFLVVVAGFKDGTL